MASAPTAPYERHGGAAAHSSAAVPVWTPAATPSSPGSSPAVTSPPGHRPYSAAPHGQPAGDPRSGAGESEAETTTSTPSPRGVCISSTPRRGTCRCLRGAPGSASGQRFLEGDMLFWCPADLAGSYAAWVCGRYGGSFWAHRCRATIHFSPFLPIGDVSRCDSGIGGGVAGL
ncbi:hypothetical protein TruAng_002461 [Truncatella angustata]|nr:hypothetical protein TruAng_002461 [Truncatella angustata]